MDIRQVSARGKLLHEDRIYFIEEILRLMGIKPASDVWIYSQSDAWEGLVGVLPNIKLRKNITNYSNQMPLVFIYVFTIKEDRMSISVEECVGFHKSGSLRRGRVLYGPFSIDFNKLLKGEYDGSIN